MNINVLGVFLPLKAGKLIYMGEKANHVCENVEFIGEKQTSCDFTFTFRAFIRCFCPEQFGVQHLTQGHFDTRIKEIETSDLPTVAVLDQF